MEDSQIRPTIVQGVPVDVVYLHAGSAELDAQHYAMHGDPNVAPIAPLARSPSPPGRMLTIAVGVSALQDPSPADDERRVGLVDKGLHLSMRLWIPDRHRGRRGGALRISRAHTGRTGTVQSAKPFQDFTPYPPCSAGLASSPAMNSVHLSAFARRPPSAGPMWTGSSGRSSPAIGLRFSFSRASARVNQPH